MRKKIWWTTSLCRILAALGDFHLLDVQQVKVFFAGCHLISLINLLGAFHEQDTKFARLIRALNRRSVQRLEGHKNLAHS